MCEQLLIYNFINNINIQIYNTCIYNIWRRNKPNCLIYINLRNLHNLQIYVFWSLQI